MRLDVFLFQVHGSTPRDLPRSQRFIVKGGVGHFFAEITAFSGQEAEISALNKLLGLIGAENRYCTAALSDLELVNLDRAGNGISPAAAADARLLQARGSRGRRLPATRKRAPPRFAEL